MGQASGSMTATFGIARGTTCDTAVCNAMTIAWQLLTYSKFPPFEPAVHGMLIWCVNCRCVRVMQALLLPASKSVHGDIAPSLKYATLLQPWHHVHRVRGMWLAGQVRLRVVNRSGKHSHSTYNAGRTHLAPPTSEHQSNKKHGQLSVCSFAPTLPAVRGLSPRRSGPANQNTMAFKSTLFVRTQEGSCGDLITAGLQLAAGTTLKAIFVVVSSSLCRARHCCLRLLTGLEELTRGAEAHMAAPMGVGYAMLGVVLFDLSRCRSRSFGRYTVID